MTLVDDLNILTDLLKQQAVLTKQIQTCIVEADYIKAAELFRQMSPVVDACALVSERIANESS